MHVLKTTAGYNLLGHVHYASLQVNAMLTMARRESVAPIQEVMGDLPLLQICAFVFTVIESRQRREVRTS